MNRIQLLRSNLEKEKGKQAQLQTDIDNLYGNRKRAKRQLHDSEKALEVVKIVGLETQQLLQFHISNLTTMAMESVFDDPYELIVEFVERRNKTECDLLFSRDGVKFDPLMSSGGGALDVASFALRIACWSMKSPRNQNVMLLDEPFKHLKGLEENRRVLEMINKIAEKLNIQIIMVSDERIPRDEILENADAVFEVTKINGKSKTVKIK